MEWIFKTFEAAVSGVISLIANGLMTVGDRAGDKALPDGRVMDGVKTRRRLKGDMAELHKLYARLQEHAPEAEETCHTLSWRVVLGVLDPTPEELTSPVVQASVLLCRQLLSYERFFPLQEVDFTRQLAMGEVWEFTKSTRRQLAFYEHSKTREEVEETLRLFVYNLLADRLPKLPVPMERADEELGVPLYSLHRAPVEDMDALIHIVFRKPEEESLFLRLGKTLEMNVNRVSGIDPHDTTSRKPLVLPKALKDRKTPLELVQLYLHDTPFADFFLTPLPFAIPLRARFSHTHILGGSGHGKTQLIQSFILRDFQMLREGKASVIVIDSQGDLCRNIQHLAAVGEIADRVVIIDPTEIAAPPALNLFDFGLERVNQYNALEREMLVNGAISLYEYVFGALLGAELTARQGVIFRYLAHLLMVVPDATIHTLIDFMEEPEKAVPYIGKLEGSARRFFETQFLSRFFNDTRQQILTRIYGVLATGVLDRMFSHKRNKVNLFVEMDRGSLILINTAKDLLKQEGTEILGRFFIALIAQAAQERASIPEDDRMSTFVYIDEAHDYFDKSIETLLEQARKYNVGLVLAHQHLGQFQQKLGETVMTNTAIKLVGGLSERDANALAKNMRTSPEFLLRVRKYEELKKTEFACYVRDLTERAITLTIPLGVLDHEPKLTPTALETIRAKNRTRVCQLDDEPDTPHFSNDDDPGIPEPL